MNGYQVQGELSEYRLLTFTSLPCFSTGQKYIYTGSYDACVYIYDVVCCPPPPYSIIFVSS